jgi:signal transduction histidine kinase
MKLVETIDAASSLEGIGASQLEEAFHRFTETSSRLEAGYRKLLEETEDLRRALREKDREVKRTEKLALLGETAAALAHEVRNPLGAIKLFTSLLRREVNDRPGALELVDQLNRAIGSLDHVVTNILHFAKDSPGGFAPLNLLAIAHELVSQCRAQEQWQGVELNVVHTGQCFMLGNEHTLRQALYNLILNAAQALRFRGRIELSITEEHEFLRITVQDNGPGIDAAVLPTIFDPFVTTRTEGTGLGLAIVRRIIQQHSGTITVENAGGARFTLELPRVVQREATSHLDDKRLSI